MQKPNKTHHFEVMAFVDKDILQIMHDTVDSGSRHGIRSFNRKKGIQRELWEVGQNNTQQSQSVQHVLYGVPFG